MTTGAAFVTIGQTPRSDLVPEMRAELAAVLPRGALEITEFGALDGLAGAELDAMRARGDEPRFVTRLADGQGILVSSARIEAALNALIARIDGRYDLIVLLCTGTQVARPERSLIVEAQALVDAMAAALVPGARRPGVLVPDERQIADFAAAHGLPKDAVLVACSPYGDGDFTAAGRRLAGCDLIVMHCMGYTAAVARTLREASGARILLARRIVAGGIAQIVAR